MTLTPDQTDNYIGLDKTTTTSIIKTQDRPDLCWAAGIQMLLNHENFQVSQEQIIRQILDIKSIDDEYDRRISGEEIGNLLKNLCFCIDGKTIRLNVTEYSLQISNDSILTELERKKPIMISYNKNDPYSNDNSTYGHIVVITGANYFVSADVKIIRQLMVLDPENKADSVLQTYSKNELHDILNSINVLWTIDVA